MIKIEIDKYGQITEQIDQVRQGDKGVVVQATFEDKDNINYVAKINLTRNDGEMATGLIMQPDAEHSDTFVRTLESEWYFCKQGPTSLTVYLYKSGVVDAQGQVNFNVEETDYDGEPTITPDQYDELVGLIATKLGIKDSIVVANTISALGNLLDYNVGQVFYIRNDGKIYQLNSSYNLDIVIDLYLVDFTILDEVEVSETKTANKITKSIALKNTHGQTFYDFDIEFNVATTSDAGLMSSVDKVKLNGLPTGAEIEQTYQTKEDAEEEHDNLQEQIDAIISKSDVVDVVGTHAELLAYDTSKLGNNDIIKVLVDETKNNQRSYYRWLKDDEEFEYVGSEGEFYTKSESDQIFLKKVDAETKYQHKVKVMNTIPTTDDLEENEIAVVPSVEDLGETIIGDGLQLTTDAQTSEKTLKVDTDVVALKSEVKKYIHKLTFIKTTHVAVTDTDHRAEIEFEVMLDIPTEITKENYVSIMPRITNRKISGLYSMSNQYPDTPLKYYPCFIKTLNAVNTFGQRLLVSIDYYTVDHVYINYFTDNEIEFEDITITDKVSEL